MKKVSLFLKKVIGSPNFLPILIIITGLLIYNYFWDIITGARILSLNVSDGASVWDLGAAFYQVWSVAHIGSIVQLSYYISIKPIIFFMLPLYELHNPFDMVYIQTFWISLAVLPLYFIALRSIRNTFLAIIVSISYLLYFGIAGLNWFDFHYQSIFPVLFISAFALSLYGKKKLSVTFFILSGLVHFPYTVLPFLLGFAFLVENFWNRKRSYEENFVWFWTFTVSLILIILSYSLIFVSSGTSPIGATVGLVPRVVSHFLAMDNKIYTIFLFLGPFLMLPILKKKWLMLLMPYFYLIFYIGTYSYRFPAIIYLQYTPLVVPFLYLGTLDVLSDRNISIIEKETKNKESFKIKQLIHNKNFKTVMTIFVLILLLGLVYEPYGPLNDHSETNFGLSNVMTYNITIYDEYTHLVQLLPTDNKYILYQNNMPEVIYKDPEALSTIGVDGYPSNFTYFIASNKSFIPLSSGYWSQDIDYILADPYSQYFLLSGTGVNSANMYETLDHFLSMGNYGVLGEYDGLILVEKGYHGRPVIYGPENQYFPSSKLQTQISSYRGNGSIAGNNLTDSQLLWFGPYTMLQPGKYTINLEISASNISLFNHFNLLVSYYSNLHNSTQTTLKVFLVSGSDLPVSNKVVNVSFNFSTDLFLENVQFLGMNFHWNGKFTIMSISVNQTQPYNYP